MVEHDVPLDEAVVLSAEATGDRILKQAGTGSAGLLKGYPPGVEVHGEPTEQPPDDESQLDRLIGTPPFNVRSDAPRVCARKRWDDYGGMAAEMTMDSMMDDSTIEKKVDFTPPTKASLAVGGFGGRHPGGALFALGDGSVRFFAQTVNPQIWLDMGNRADQELADDSYY
ncbi:MAG: hypothetical protein CMJ64_18680 [Planctomycetaceae bacterium]|nr:hypothetical protein [Planctomycetaceae bacterium]